MAPLLGKLAATGGVDAVACGGALDESPEPEHATINKDVIASPPLTAIRARKMFAVACRAIAISAFFMKQIAMRKAVNFRMEIRPPALLARGRIVGFSSAQIPRIDRETA